MEKEFFRVIHKETLERGYVRTGTLPTAGKLPVHFVDGTERLIDADLLKQCSNKSSRQTTEPPQRIQRKRSKGWRMPAGAVSVCRPGLYGNPFRVRGGVLQYLRSECNSWQNLFHLTDEDPGEIVVNYFSKWMRGVQFSGLKSFPNIEPLRGKDLACWCKIGSPCHADILLREANK